MTSKYERVSEVKQALEELSPELPEIEGRGEQQSVATFGKSVDLPLRGSINPESIFAIDNRILNFTEWFIEQSYENGELRPSRIRGYIGLIGTSGQMLDYLHTDPISERITSTITSVDGYNPSTRTFPKLRYLDLVDKAQRQYLNYPTSAIPDHYFQPQVDEGGIVHFEMYQLHTEAVLPIGAAKIFLSADFKY
jgi:hypothetical protein